MADFYVAKTYDNWPRETEPYIANGRYYVKVRSPKGDVKQVRAYNEREYAKLYKEAPCASPVQPTVNTQGPVVKKILGFEKGYIWIFKGDLDNAEYWFTATKECRYHCQFGWYIVSTDEIPTNIPSCITPVRLEWEKVGNENGTLLPKEAVASAIESLIYGVSASEHQGTIGERLERAVTIVSVIPLGETQYGSSTLFVFEDCEQNQYTWVTSTGKSWKPQDSLKIRGTVKSHQTYKGIKRTNLNRVTEVK